MLIEQAIATRTHLELEVLREASNARDAWVVQSTVLDSAQCRFFLAVPSNRRDRG